jgi:hypothetical protein
MKSYFAKLADRATLANVPAPAPVHAPRVSDPFEEAPTEQAQLPTPGRNQQRLAPRDPDGFALTPSDKAKSTQDQRTVVETHQHEPTEMPTEIATLQPKPPEQTLGYKFDEKQEPIESRAQQTGEQIKSEVREVVTLLPNKTPDTQPVTIKAPADENEGETQEPASSNDLGREQALLLRKADLFMSSLLDAQREPSLDETRTTEPAVHSLKKLERDPTSRLEPAPRNLPAPVQEATGPSLVIGKLTVEVTPSGPPPVAPQPQRLIVRGSRGFGRGVMSSRRFGLGQF